MSSGTPPDGPGHPFDKNGDGRVTVADWTGVVNPNEGENEADSVLDASDLIAHYSNGDDADRNGYVDDIAGWDFFDNDNDPFDQSDCCQSGHGTDRAQDAAAEGNNGNSGIGICPRCTFMPLRTSDSIVHDTNLVALGTIYAADNGAEVTECACGGLANSVFARRALRYADAKGVAQMMVSSDINSANHNYPTNYNEAIYVAGSLPDTAPNETCQLPGRSRPRWVAGRVRLRPGLQLVQAVPHRRRRAVHRGHLGPAQHDELLPQRQPDAVRRQGRHRADGRDRLREHRPGGRGGRPDQSFGREQFPAGNPGGFPTSLTGNEIRQLLTMTAEDVLPENTGSIGLPDKANPGWDPHFGYGRVNLPAAMQRVQARKIPPEVQINSPDWFAPIDVAKVGADGVPVDAHIASPHFDGPVSWKLEYACGQDALDSSFQPISSGEADAVDGEIAKLSKSLLQDLADNCDGSIANDAGSPAGTPCRAVAGQSVSEPRPDAPRLPDPAHRGAEGRPHERGALPQDAFRLRGRRDTGRLAEADRAGVRQGQLVTGSGGEASPRLFDMDGDNKLDVFVPTTSGELQVLDSAGNAGELVERRQPGEDRALRRRVHAPRVARAVRARRRPARGAADARDRRHHRRRRARGGGHRRRARLRLAPRRQPGHRLSQTGQHPFSDACNGGALRCFDPA